MGTTSFLTIRVTGIRTSVHLRFADTAHTPRHSSFGAKLPSGCCDAVPGGGRVVMLTISHYDHSARTSDVAYNHYSMLATIEDGWKLGCLAFACDTANVPRLTDLVGPGK
jgi:hypothetical protein